MKVEGGTRRKVGLIGHFRDASILFFKTRLNAKSLISKYIISQANKAHFHMKGFALGLVLKVRFLELGNGLFHYIT